MHTEMQLRQAPSTRAPMLDMLGWVQRHATCLEQLSDSHRAEMREPRALLPRCFVVHTIIRLYGCDTRGMRTRTYIEREAPSCPRAVILMIA